MGSLCDQVHGRLYSTISRILVKLKYRWPTLLDVGCHDGTMTSKYARDVGAGSIIGIEFFENLAEEARLRGITVWKLDLERGCCPRFR